MLEVGVLTGGGTNDSDHRYMARNKTGSDSSGEEMSDSTWKLQSSESEWKYW